MGSSKYSIPYHSSEQFRNFFEGKPAETFANRIVCTIKEPTYSDNKVRVDYVVTRYQTATNFQTQEIFYEFPGPAQLNPALLYLLGYLSCNWAGLHCNYHYGRIDVEIVSKLRFGLSKVQKDAVDKFYQDFVWQNKAGNAWRGLATDSVDQKTLELRKSYLPTVPFKYVEFPYRDYADPARFKKVQSKNCILGMSFGKESLLTYALLQLEGKLSDIKLGMVNYADNDLIAFDKLKGFAELYPKLMPDFQREVEKETNHRPQVVKVRTNFYQQFNKEVAWDVINYFQQIYTVLLALTGANVVYLGDEFECSIKDVLAIKDEFDFVTASPVYTLDYHQHFLAHSKINSLFRLLKVECQVQSLVANLSEVQIQFLLDTLKPNWSKFQASCWFSNSKNRWCNDCSKCARIALVKERLGQPLPEGLLPFSKQSHKLQGPQIFATDIAAGNSKTDQLSLFIQDEASKSLLEGKPFSQIFRKCLEEETRPFMLGTSVRAKIEDLLIKGLK